MLLAANENLIGACLAGFALLGLSFVLIRRSMKATEKGRDEKRHSHNRRDKGPSQPLRGEAERVLVELQEFGREIEGRLETRIRHLARLIGDADRASERLSSLLAASKEKEAGGGEEVSNSASETGRPKENPLKEKIAELSRKGNSSSEIANALNVPKGEVELILGLEGEEKND